MKKYVKIAVGVLLLPGMVMANVWTDGVVGDWETAANWTPGIPGAANDATIGGAASVATLSSSTAAGRLIMENSGSLVIAAGGNLVVNGQTLLGNAASSVNSAIVVDGGQLTASTEFAIGVTGSGMLTINTGTVNANGGWLIPGYLAGSAGDITVNGGTLNSAGPLYAGFNGDGSLTVAGGNVNLSSHLIVGANAGSIGDVVINGGVTTTIALNFGGAGTQTLDLNGGQLITTGGFSEGANSTFYIGDGELVFNGGQSLLEVQDLVSGSNWIFDDTASVVDSGSGIVVTSIPEPATMGLLVLFGGTLLGARRRRLFNR